MTDLLDEWFDEPVRDDTARRRWHAGLALGLALAVVVGLGAVAVGQVGKAFATKPAADYAGPAAGAVQIQVHSGDSTRAIGITLQKADVVKSVSAFVSAAAMDDRSRRIQPGIYQLKVHMPAVEALALLLDPTALVGGRVTVPEGATEAKILSIITKNTKLTSADVEAALANPEALGLPAWAGGHVEGFLYPSTYDVNEDTTATELLTMMVARFNEHATRLNLEARAKAAGLKPYQVLTIASLIEAEVKLPDDQAKVSRVIRNRLAKKMKLQLDSTVNYALKTSKLRLSSAELAVDSPYNTYRYAGLPPRPINSPDADAIEAALAPVDGNWVYFVTVDPETGETQFTADPAEFARLKALFLTTQGSSG